MTPPQAQAQTPDRAVQHDYDYSNFYYSSSDDLFAIFEPYDEWWYGSARTSGYYLFSQPMSTRSISGSASIPVFPLLRSLRSPSRSLP